MLKTLLVLFLITTSTLQGRMAAPSAYEKNPYVSDTLWNTLSPYFVPENSPEKAALDTIFKKPGVLTSQKSLAEAGFLLITNPKEKVIVAKHPYLKGYFVKIHLDYMQHADGDCWRRRVEGANVIRNGIAAHGYEHIMKAPRKWIYPLPPDPTPAKSGQIKKNFVLLVEEVDILSDKSNRKAYKTKMTPEILDALYTMLTCYLLIDSVYADNTPFCKDGRQAFIDTEWAGDTTMAVPLSAVGQYLSPTMLSYWEQLLTNGTH